MFGTYYNNKHLYNITAAFGTLFNDIYVVRADSSGNVVSQEKVPIAYGARDKHLARIREQPDFDDTKIALKLPRMSFQMTNMTYDNSRQLNKFCRTNVVSPSGDNNKRGSIRAGAPYNLEFELNIMAKTYNDAHQIIEQILPNFNPSLGLTIKPLKDYPTITQDVKVTLNSAVPSDEYTGDLKERRVMIFTLSFTVSMVFTTNIADSKVIKNVTVNIRDFDDSTITTGITSSVNPSSATEDDSYTIDVTNFGFE